MSTGYGRPSLASTLARKGMLAATTLWAVSVALCAVLSYFDHQREERRAAGDIAQAAMTAADTLSSAPGTALLQNLVASHERLLGAACINDKGEVVSAWPEGVGSRVDLTRASVGETQLVAAQGKASGASAWRVGLPLVGRGGACFVYVRATGWATARLGPLLVFGCATFVLSMILGSLHAAKVRRLLRTTFDALADDLRQEGEAPPREGYQETEALCAEFDRRAKELADAQDLVAQLERQMQQAIHHRERTFARTLEKSRRETLTDPLTGLYNRRFLDEDLPKLLGEVEARGGDVTMVMIDLDHFKQHNDSNGHEAGDELLKFVGELLKGATRDSDYCIRYGGDEFAVVMPDTPQEQAVRVIDRIVKLFAQYAAVFKSQPRVSMSAGIASSTSRPAEQRRQLITLADRALYDAKHMGKNRVTVAA